MADHHFIWRRSWGHPVIAKKCFIDEIIAAKNALSNAPPTAIKIFSVFGAGIDAVDNNGWTPLHTAVRWGRKEIVEMLIDAGADVRLGDKDGWDTSSLCCEMG